MAGTRRMVAYVAVAGVAVLVGAVLVLLLRPRGPGDDPARPAAASQAPGGAGTPAALSGTGSPGAHQDPFPAAATAYLASRHGTVIAAVYDVGTGQTWRLGTDSEAQPEASIVKLDILETLLARPQ